MSIPKHSNLELDKFSQGNAGMRYCTFTAGEYGNCLSGIQTKVNGDASNLFEKVAVQMWGENTRRQQAIKVVLQRMLQSKFKIEGSRKRDKERYRLGGER